MLIYFEISFDLCNNFHKSILKTRVYSSEANNAELPTRYYIYVTQIWVGFII